MKGRQSLRVQKKTAKAKQVAPEHQVVSLLTLQQSKLNEVFDYLKNMNAQLTVLAERLHQLEQTQQVTVAKPLKSTTISTPKQKKEDLKQSFSKALTLLDPISDLCWSDAFSSFGIVRDKFKQQLDVSTADFAFMESAWKANNSTWLYAFNSPNLQHNNAQDLLKIIGILRQKKLPMLFWNKEDPMHYEMFKPIAKEADYVFTTDSLMVEKYKKDLGHDHVWALPFAAPIKVTNPVGRFSMNTASVCFAGTYYAKNHPDRKKQMDMLLPSLLAHEGFIYDRASGSTSENYQFPSQYRDVIRDGVGFSEMTTLYKKFKVFLNVNTITQSPTMMSRRVYELLASGTPVVSTPSKAITSQFPGIVLTVRNEEEANLAIHKLLTDSYFWHKQSVRGIREVMSKHTYEDRWAVMRSQMTGKAEVQAAVRVNVVAIYHANLSVTDYLQQLYDQVGIEIQMITLVKTASQHIDEQMILDLELACGVTVVDIADFNLSDMSSNQSEYTYITNDSILHFKNCIGDLLLSFKYHQGAAASKKVVYAHDALVSENDLSLTSNDWHEYVDQTDLDSVLLKNKEFAQFDISLATNVMKSKDACIYTIDPFNVVRYSADQQSTAYSLSAFMYKYAPLIGI